jgi:cell growth-regulating nucleolar protein
MVSFSCEVCNDTILKKKLQQHQRSCQGAYFTCIDCSTTFYGNDHQKHTSCISEAEKYEKSLYKGKKTKNQNQQKQQPKKEINPQQKQEQKQELKIESKSKFDLSKYIEDTPTSLYKIFKSAKKENKNLSDKNDFLKNIKVLQNKDGSYSLSI